MFRKLSIKQKLVLIMFIPLFVVFLLAIKLEYSAFTQEANLEKIDKIVVLSTKIGTFVHETQKERGMTAGFLGSKGAKFSSEIIEQRRNTDEKKKIFLSYLEEINLDDYSLEFKNDVNKGLSLLNNIENIRTQVSSQNIVTSEAIAYYTNMNASFLNIIGTAVSLSKSSVLTQKLTAYMNFLLSKERAGIERAVGSNTFARDNFGEGMKVKLISLVAQQNAYMDAFLKVASDESKEFFNKTVQGESVNEVERMRKILFQNDLNFGVEAKYWFDTITKKINLLKQVEDYLEKSIVEESELEKSNTINEMILFTILSLLGIILTLLFGRVIAYNIIHDVTKLKVGMNDFFAFVNHEKKDVNAIEVHSNDELGQMAELINKNIINTKNNISKDNDLLGETITLANSVSIGHLSQRISKNSNNPQLNDLKNIINNMLQTLEENLVKISNVLSSYSSLDYRPKLDKNNLEGTLAKLCEDTNKLGVSITETLVENKRNGMILSQNSDTLSKSLSELNNAATSQAASLEETAASLEELTENLKQNTSSTIEMSTYGKKVKDSVSSGQSLATKTVEAMEDINSQTEAITEAITIIDQIAFQTNILSLNAAVEAATAGEAGKGFAVVAGEVRNLASRSAEAAKEIKDLVDNAQEKTNYGKNIANDMISGYNGLNEDISKTITLIDNVAFASKEQELGIVQINDAVNQLDQITQNNAKNTAIADEIAKQTEKISKIIVEKADAKEFDGKNDIKLRKNTINESFSGVEKRSVEKRVKVEDEKKYQHTKTHKNLDTKPSVKTSFPKEVPAIKKQEPKIIKSSSSSDDEWESF